MRRSSWLILAALGCGGPKPAPVAPPVTATRAQSDDITRIAIRPPFGPPVLRSSWPPAGVGEYGQDVSGDGKTMILSMHAGAPLQSNLWISTRSCL